MSSADFRDTTTGAFIYQVTWKRSQEFILFLHWFHTHDPHRTEKYSGHIWIITAIRNRPEAFSVDFKDTRIFIHQVTWKCTQDCVCMSFLQFHIHDPHRTEKYILVMSELPQPSLRDLKYSVQISRIQGYLFTKWHKNAHRNLCLVLAVPHTWSTQDREVFWSHLNYHSGQEQTGSWTPWCMFEGLHHWL